MYDCSNAIEFLDKKVKDTASGFEGLCTGFAFYTDGIVRLQITPHVVEPGKYLEPQWFSLSKVVTLPG